MQPARAWHRSQHSCCVDACTRGQSTPSFQSKPALNVHFAGGGGTGCFGLSAVQEAPLPVVSDRNASPATVQSPNHFCRELQHGPTRRSSARGAWQADCGTAHLGGRRELEQRQEQRRRRARRTAEHIASTSTRTSSSTASTAPSARAIPGNFLYDSLRVTT